MFWANEALQGLQCPQCAGSSPHQVGWVGPALKPDDMRHWLRTSAGCQMLAAEVPLGLKARPGLAAALRLAGLRAS